jgi:predicted nucleotidyltransferase
LDRDAVTAFCRRWRVRELSLFGSAVREDFGPASDVDFLVSFDPDAPWSLWDLEAMREELEAMTGRAVDLVEKEALRNPFRRREILSTREIIHAS